LTRELYLANGAPPEKVLLSYYGIDLPARLPEPTGALRAALALPVGRRIVGMVAYIYPPKRLLGQRRGIKGHEDLIDALTVCVGRGLDVQGVFIGGAWGSASSYEARVRAYAVRRLGDRATFLGTRTDVAALYPELDVAVHPSHSENVGGAGESLLAGVPTVATAVGGLPDFVVPGVTGWLVPPRDPVRLADGIAEALAHPARSRAMALAGRETVLAQLDVKKTAAEVRSIYSLMLEKARTGHGGAR
jgi:glycosyltransferase involved in cell wall biosynthesis